MTTSDIKNTSETILNLTNAVSILKSAEFSYYDPTENIVEIMNKFYKDFIITINTLVKQIVE